MNKKTIKIFLRPTKGKVLLSFALLLIFSYLGSHHIQICKFPPCEPIPTYSISIIYITLWPLFIVFAGQFFEVIAFFLLPVYYYFLSCLWFYKKGKNKLIKYFLLTIAIIVIAFTIFVIFQKEDTKDGILIQQKVINYADEQVGKNYEFENMVPSRAIKMYEDDDAKWFLLISQEEQENKLVFINYGSDGSSAKNISDEQYKQLYDINNIIIESVEEAYRDESISTLIYDLRGMHPFDYQYTYEPLGDIYEYKFNYVGEDREGIGHFPMSYSIFVDNDSNIFYTQFTDLLFVD